MCARACLFEGVKAFEWTVFGEPSDSYVTQRSIRYPKAGSPNPTVRLHLTSVAEGAQSVDLHAPSHLASEDHYLMQVGSNVDSVTFFLIVNLYLLL